MRSYLRNLINKNFFNYKYDYRDEWTKFIPALSAVEENGTPLKVLRTFADLMDSPGGALWIWKDSFRQFVPMAKWSIKDESEALSPPTIRRCRPSRTKPHADRPDRPTDVRTTRVWREQFPGHWLVVPLRYRCRTGRLHPAVQKPAHPRSLDWEDNNLVSLVAHAAGGLSGQ